MIKMFFEYMSLSPWTVVVLVIFLAGCYVWLFRFRRKMIDLRREHEELYKAHKRAEINSEQTVKTLHKLEESLARTESTLEVILKLLVGNGTFKKQRDVE